MWLERKLKESIFIIIYLWFTVSATLKIKDNWGQGPRLLATKKSVNLLYVPIPDNFYLRGKNVLKKNNETVV